MPHFPIRGHGSGLALVLNKMATTYSPSTPNWPMEEPIFSPHIPHVALPAPRMGHTLQPLWCRRSSPPSLLVWCLSSCSSPPSLPSSIRSRASNPSTLCSQQIWIQLMSTRSSVITDDRLAVYFYCRPNLLPLPSNHFVFSRQSHAHCFSAIFL